MLLTNCFHQLISNRDAFCSTFAVYYIRPPIKSACFSRQNSSLALLATRGLNNIWQANENLNLYAQRLILKIRMV